MNEESIIHVNKAVIVGAGLFLLGAACLSMLGIALTAPPSHTATAATATDYTVDDARAHQEMLERLGQSPDWLLPAAVAERASDAAAHLALVMETGLSSSANISELILETRSVVNAASAHLYGESGRILVDRKLYESDAFPTAVEVLQSAGTYDVQRPGASATMWKAIAASEYVDVVLRLPQLPDPPKPPPVNVNATGPVQDSCEIRGETFFERTFRLGSTVDLHGLSPYTIDIDPDGTVRMTSCLEHRR